MKTHVLVPALAALAMFVFGAIFWMSPFPYKALSPTADDRVTLAALDAVFPATGLYILPGPHLDTEVAAELYRAGPNAMVHFVKEGREMMEPAVFLQGYLHYFAVAFLLAILLRKSAGSFQGYCCVVKLSTLVGLIGTLLLALGNPIWWDQSWSWGFINLLYGTLSFMVAGLVLGKFIKPVPAPAAA